MNTQTLLDIKVTTRSARRRIVIDENKNIKVYLNSPPADGKANTECITLFSKKLKVARSKISIQTGLRGRNKRIAIEGLSLEETMIRLENKE